MKRVANGAKKERVIGACPLIFDLIRRMYEHKSDFVEGFTKNYQVHDLVYFEVSESVESAIDREKQLKKWHRAWKVRLIEKENPEWKDLYPEIVR